MEPVIRDGCGDVVGRRERVAEAGLIDVHERGPAALKQLDGVRRVPGAVTELGGERELAEAVEQPGEELPVGGSVVKRHRKLGEDAAQPPGLDQRAHRFEEGAAVRLAGFALVRETSVELRREGEPRVVLDPPSPVPRHARRGDPVEGRIDLVGVEDRRHPGQAVETPRGLRGIDDPDPVIVGPSGGADADHRDL
jgi:hypothetical protein